MLKRVLILGLLCAIPMFARADEARTGDGRVIENPTSGGTISLRVNNGGTKQVGLLLRSDTGADFGLPANTAGGYFSFNTDSDTGNALSLISTSGHRAGFATMGGTGHVGLVMSTASASQGNWLESATVNGNTGGDMVFDILENDGTSFGTTTSKGWRWTHNASEVANMTRAGVLQLSSYGRGVLETSTAGVISANNNWSCGVSTTDADCGASPCAQLPTRGGCAADSGAITRSATGVYSITFTTSFWSAAPICTAVSTRGSSQICAGNTPGSAVSFGVNCFTSNTAAAVDSRFAITCVGPRT